MRSSPSHLEMARRDPDYKFVLAELDYLKPYWDAYPEDREYVRRTPRHGPARVRRRDLQRAEHEPDERRIDDPERHLRHRLPARRARWSAGHGLAARRVRSRPAVPGDHGRRGRHLELLGARPVPRVGTALGPRSRPELPFAELAAAPDAAMQFPMEFDWIAPSGRALLTSFMADHYSAGWWMDAALTLEAAEAEVYRLFLDLAAARGDEERPPARRYRLHAAEQVGDRDPARLEQPVRLAEVHHRDPARLLRRGSGRKDGERPAVLAADAGHEPDLHRQGRLVHRHQAGPARRREHAAGGREVRDDRDPARRPVPDRGGRQGLATAPVRGPPRRHHRLRIGPGLSRPARWLARGGRARARRARRGARLPRRVRSTRRATASRSRSSMPCRGRGPTSPESRSTCRTVPPVSRSEATATVLRCPVRPRVV